MAYKYPYDEEEKKYTAPKLQTNRSMWKFMLLNTCTLGIYSVIFFIPFSFDLDLVAPKPDRSKTPNYLFAFILSYFTVSIVLQIWLYHITERVEEALDRYKIDYNFGTEDFWKYQIFGQLVLVGPFIYIHKLCTAMNLLCGYYNTFNNL